MAGVTDSRTPSYWVAVNMHRLRTRQKLTQEAFGKPLGWSKTVVSAAENSNNGKRPRKFGIDEVVRIADVLGVTVNDLIKPLPPCGTCNDEPPAGFTCNACGMPGGERR